MRKKKIVSGDLVLTWSPGRNSALDTASIGAGRDIGNVIVQRRSGENMQDVVYDLTFAFVFHAFVASGTIHK